MLSDKVKIKAASAEAAGIVIISPDLVIQP